jgi:hypothetical protein
MITFALIDVNPQLLVAKFVLFGFCITLLSGPCVVIVNLVL